MYLPVKKRYVKAVMVATSPLKIGSGENDATDSDVLLDAKGEPFVPGTAIAGLMRHYLAEKVFDTPKNQESIEDSKSVEDIVDYWFGYIVKNQDIGQASKVNTFDAPQIIKTHSEARGQWPVSTRDGVKLDSFKTVEANSKYDYQVVNKGTSFNLKLEIDYDDNPPAITDGKEYCLDCLTNDIIAGFQTGDISIGGKTTRGFGRVKLYDIKYQDIDMRSKAGIDSYLKFCWETGNWETYEAKPEGIASSIYENPRIIKFNIPSFLIIRNLASLEKSGYQDKLVDAEMLKADDHTAAQTTTLPVIPGTSWAGLFRHHMYKILMRANYGEKPTEDFLNSVFGYVQGKRKAKSKIEFEESYVSDSNQVNRTRNAVDRFTGGAGDKKLFTTQVSYGGHFELSIKWRKAIPGIDMCLLDSLVTTAIADINEGLAAIGGMTAIGGGILVQEVYNA